MDIVGLMPAGGQAMRIAPLPCSKELYPIGFRLIAEDGSLRPKVACHYLLEKMQLAGINKVYIILRDGIWDAKRQAHHQIRQVHIKHRTVTKISRYVPFTIS